MTTPITRHSSLERLVPRSYLQDHRKKGDIMTASLILCRWYHSLHHRPSTRSTCLLLSFILCRSLIENNASAYSTGAGACHGDKPAVQAPHTIFWVNNIDLHQSDFEVYMDDVLLDPVKTTNFDIDVLHTLTLSTSRENSSRFFRGVLFRLEMSSSTSSMTSMDDVLLVPQDAINFMEATVCESEPGAVVGITHTSRIDKTEATATLSVENNAVGIMKFDVTVVVHNWEYYYGQFMLNAVTVKTNAIPSIAWWLFPSADPTSAAPTNKPTYPPTPDPSAMPQQPRPIAMPTQTSSSTPEPTEFVDVFMGEAGGDDDAVLRGDSIFFNDGRPLPTGTYRIDYVDGCMKYFDPGHDWTVNYGFDNFGWWLVTHEPDTNIIRLLDAVQLPGTNGFTTSNGAFELFASCIAANQLLDPVLFNLTAEAPVGVWLADARYDDNVPGLDGRNPKWNLTLISALPPPIARRSFR